jgi:hypothetical protein
MSAAYAVGQGPPKLAEPSSALPAARKLAWPALAQHKSLSDDLVNEAHFFRCVGMIFSAGVADVDIGWRPPTACEDVAL